MSYRIIHYINQFYAGIGGEEKADVAPEIREGVVGPGMALKAALGTDAEIVATVVCGDSYFASNMEKASAEILDMMKKYKPDAVVAGPAFNAGGQAGEEVFDGVDAQPLGFRCGIGAGMRRSMRHCGLRRVGGQRAQQRVAGLQTKGGGQLGARGHDGVFHRFDGLFDLQRARRGVAQHVARQGVGADGQGQIHSQIGLRRAVDGRGKLLKLQR